MERILSVEQMKAADDYTINSLGFSAESLTERAGLAVADEIVKRFKGGRVLVCIGKGNNGEDGKIIAKALSLRHGFTVATINVANGIFRMFDKKYDIIVDCIFGTGLNRNIDGKYKEAIERINSSGAYVISCDIPSGINGNTGMVCGVAVKANLTVAIQEYKLGHFLGFGSDYTGEVVAKDIGISIWGEEYYKRLSKNDVAKFFIPQSKTINKGCLGKTLIIGGSLDFAGSALLSFNAILALRTGNGYSYLAAPESIYNVIAGIHPECIIKRLKDLDGKIVYDEKALSELLNFDSIAFGMGTGVSEDIYKTVGFLLEHYEGNLLIDADGLNSIAKYGVDILKNKKCSVTVTPHVGEFARLVNKEKEEVLNNAILLAKDFATRYNVTVNLKNSTSIITDGNEVIINTTGCNGMAKAGSGDVLSGITAGLLAKSTSVTEATAAAAYIFGKAGEYAQKIDNEFTLTASDVVAALPKVINSL